MEKMKYDYDMDIENKSFKKNTRRKVRKGLQ